MLFVITLANSSGFGTVGMNEDVDVSVKIVGVSPPNHPIKKEGFPLFSPSILGFSPYFWKHPCDSHFFKYRFVNPRGHVFRGCNLAPLSKGPGIHFETGTMRLMSK